jgi:hypothetical protein
MAEDTHSFLASSNLAEGVYDPETRIMRIEFRSGRTYAWENVEPFIWDHLKSAPSAGRYLQLYFPEGVEE